MTAAIYPWVIEQGATLSEVLTYKDPLGAPINLTGYTARCQVRRSIGGAVILNLTTENGGITLGGAAGTITRSATPAVTALLSGVGVYDLEIESSGGRVDRIIEGTVEIKPNVTRG